jgi:hypothetical protein
MMHDSRAHLSEEELHDAADGAIAGDDPRVARHVAHCADCRSDVERIRDLLARAAALPKAIDPPEDLWSGIQSRLRPTGAGAGDPPARAIPTRRSAWTDRRWLAAAAAVLLVVASSGITALVMTQRGDNLVADGGRGAVIGQPAESAATFQTVSAEYDRMDRELAALLSSQREKLQPETVAKVERNLAIIDDAIAEIRQALREDPGNDALHQLLKASYGQKAALLRQVSQT